MSAFHRPSAVVLPLLFQPGQQRTLFARGWGGVLLEQALLQAHALRELQVMQVLERQQPFKVQLPVLDPVLQLQLPDAGLGVHARMRSMGGGTVEQWACGCNRGRAEGGFIGTGLIRDLTPPSQLMATPTDIVIPLSFCNETFTMHYNACNTGTLNAAIGASDANQMSSLTTEYTSLLAYLLQVCKR